MIKPRVVLLGNKNIAVGCLDQLLEWDRSGELELTALIACHDDDPGRLTWSPSATAFALSHGIPVYYPRSVNDAEFLPVLKQLSPDIMVSAQYNRILKSHVIAVPRLGAINIHFAPLPKYRGVLPIVWALVEGGPSGVTIHYIDPGIDTGDIIAQTLLPLYQTETARSLYDRASEAGLALFRGTFPSLLRGRAGRVRQMESAASYHSAGYPYDRWIDWELSADQIDRFVRALTFPPYPTARTTFGGEEIELLHPLGLGAPGSGADPGTILSVDGAVRVAAGEGTVEIRRFRRAGVELTAEGAAEALLFRAGARFESCSWAASAVSVVSGR